MSDPTRSRQVRSRAAASRPATAPAGGPAGPAPLDAVLDAAGIMQWQMDAAGAMTWASAELLGFLGIAAARARDGWMACVHPEDQGAVRAAVSTARAERQLLTIATRLRRSDGVYRQILHRAGPLGDGLAGLAFDVSELEFEYVTHVCRGCKRVTDLDGRWRLSWDYLLGQSRLDFTTCVDCTG